MDHCVATIIVGALHSLVPEVLVHEHQSAKEHHEKIELDFMLIVDPRLKSESFSAKESSVTTTTFQSGKIFSTGFPLL